MALYSCFTLCSLSMVFAFTLQPSMTKQENERQQNISSPLKGNALIECSETLSCRNRSQLITYPVNETEDVCYCDSLCQAMRDCCYDYYLYNSTEVPDSVVDSTWSCVKLGTAEPVWMKKNCSKTWTEPTNATRCLNAPETLNSSTFTDFIPVVGADNLTYRNQFCAVCNYQNEFEFWELDVVVYPTGVSNVVELMEFLVNYYGEGINDIVIPKNKPRRYCQNATSTCLNEYKNTEKEQDCLFGKVGVVYNWEQPYKNVACALCNNLNTTQLQCKREQPPAEGPGKIPSRDFDFYIIVDIRNTKTTRFTTSSSCGTKKVFDNHLKTCVSEVVPPQKSVLDKYRIALWLTTNAALPEKISSENISKFIYDVSPSNIHREVLTKITDNRYLLTFEVDLTFIQTVKLSRNTSTSNSSVSGAYSIKKFIRPFSGVFSIRIVGIVIKVVKITYRRLACFGLKNYNRSEYVEVEGKIFVNKTGKYYSSGQYFEDTSSDGIKVCEQQLPSECDGRYIKYNLSEFDVAQENLSLYHRKEKVLYDHKRYSIKSDSVFICHEVSDPTIGDNVRGFITIIGLSLSVISLLAVLMTYSLFPQLRTPSGRNLMNLALALLIIDLLWLSRGWFKSLSPLCVIMAFVQQYFILVSLTSMAKIAHDTMGMFTDPIAFQRRNSSTCLKFFVFWLIPVAHVVVCVILSQYNILTVSHNCWITGTHQYIVAVVPVCTSMFYNIFCFTRSIIEMRKLQKNGQMLRAQAQEKSSVLVYIKISTLLGLGWSSTFVAVIFPVFSYVFVFFTSFQGVYIFLAFVCNQNVFMLYKRLYNGQSKSRQTVCTRSTVRESTLDKL